MMKLMTAISILLCTLVAGIAVADVGVTYIRAGQLVDVTAGKLLRDQVIVVQGDKILRVEDAADVTLAADAAVIDLSAYTVLPPGQRQFNHTH